ncbi:hypothetical protein ACFU8Q_35860 [Streptomyces sp. NPDC057543]|uniref:hypothetical protein n=1 Tax=Streptomyces sp. NPDC057543 TaxID=3346163 RepID=UPI0036CE694E
MLLGDFGPVGQDDVDAARGDLSEAGAEVAHQALAVEAVADPRFRVGGGLFLLSLVGYVLSFGDER